MKKKLLSYALLSFGLLAQAQVHFSENFESGNVWTYTDLDGDGNQFAVLNASSIQPTLGTKTLVSYSYTTVALSPDNLATSPPITLPTGVSNLFLKYNVGSYTGSYGSEHYAVYLTTSNTSAAITSAAPVKEETLAFAGGLKSVAVDVSAFAGKTVYLTVRHYNCTDMYYLLMDDFSIETLTPNNATLASASISKYIAASSQNDLSLTVKNSGSNAITSVEVNWNDGTDHVATIPVSIASGQSATVVHPSKVSYSDITKKTINISITKVNTTADSNPADNTSSASTYVVSQIVPKKVVFEEGTGTWCGWCVRGIVALHDLNTLYPDDQISIGVHNGDPMVLAAYNSGAAFSSFPGMNVDRELKGVDISPDDIGDYVATRKNIPTPVKLSGTYSITGNQMSVQANAQFFTNFSDANYKLLAVVIEDGVKGTASTYAQKNYYAGGGYGPMAGYENMPATIPAAQMVYDHVGRALLGGYNGQASSIPAAISNEQVVPYTFSYTIPTAYVANNLSVALLLIDASNNTIVNGAKLTKQILAVNDLDKLASSTTIYPNPAKADFNIKMSKDGEYTIAIFDMSGREVKNFGLQSVRNGNIKLPINLTSGNYMVNIAQDGQSITKHLIVK